MVLGVKNKSRRGPSIQVEYIVHVQDIKPWPPTQLLKSVKSVMFQWGNGERNSGTTSVVTPSLDHGKIEFNETFRLPVMLSRDMSVKNGDVDVFNKNLLEFNLYEPRRDKTVKGQLLGTSIVDLADYGALKEVTSVVVPLNCTRSFRNSVQPCLHLRIQAYDKARSGSSLMGRLVKEGSIDKNDRDSVSALMNEEYADEAGSLIDDDTSSLSSMIASSVIESGASPSLRMEEPIDPKSENGSECHLSEDKGKRMELPQGVRHGKAAGITHADEADAIKGDDHVDKGHAGRTVHEECHLVVDKSAIGASINAVQIQILSGSDADSLTEERPHHVKSVRCLVEPNKTNGSLKRNSKTYLAEKQSGSFNSKIKELEQRITFLETELREVAAMEVALYSISAEHGSSINKVHAPARRLCRLYLQASNGMTRASAARSAVSGLVLVAKACGNDVPRLTFWLSNCVVLRAIVSDAFEEEQLPVSAGSFSDRNGIGKGVNKTTLRWKVFSFEKQPNSSIMSENSQDWGNPNKFMSALEKLESWIFSRIIESVWWQTLTPHMQSSAAKMVDNVMDSSCNNYRRTSSSGHQEQVNMSLELWKRAFKDACEQLCPVRSGGHECGCLPVLAKLIMEQCVARLDVAMFNAILRESSEDIPTDPVSDPISDLRVLPIPTGKSCFAAGAQLKNAIGNWLRWLAELFGIDDDAPENGMIDTDELNKNRPSCNSFHLLKSLSDLMMLPKDMLLNESVRREVCPAFGAPLIKRVLKHFVPDEFCSDPIPDAVFEALDVEIIRAEAEGITANYPCTVPVVRYSPPSTNSMGIIVGGCLETGNHSQLRRCTSILKRSNTSDDELDELDSPLSSILGDKHINSSQASSTHLRLIKNVQNHHKISLRYQLLREVWNDDQEL